MNWKKLGKNLLFPHLALLLFLLPVSVVALVWAMVTLPETSLLRIGAYVLAFYTLCIWCLQAPKLVRALGRLRRENPYVLRWLSDARLRVNVTLTGSVLWNGAYAALQLGLAIVYRSAWFYSLAGYYLCLVVMRLFILRHTLGHHPGVQMGRELKLYRRCGWSFLAMNLALSGVMLFLIRDSRGTRHHEIVTIAMAAYTFTSLIMAIVNVVKCRKYNSPALSASKAISLAAACVSMLTLESTMLVTFEKGKMTPQVQSLFLALSGGAVSMGIIIMAVYMIAHSNEKMKCLEK